MKRSGAAFVGLVLCASAIASPARSADNPPVVGTWQLNGYSQEFLDTKEVTRPFGDRPTGYIQYSPGGHMVVFLMSGDVPRPAAAAYTDAERVAFQKSIIGAYAGTYTVEGNKVIHHILTSWRPEWIGGDQARFFETDGKTLTIKTAPIKFSRTGQDMVSTLTFQRVE
ncbi:lipocalin-like domain-containing protein [Methylobacterium sp. P31]